MAAAKADLAQRSHDLGHLLVEADAFLLEERRSRKAARKCAPLHELQGGPCSCLSLPAADSLLSLQNALEVRCSGTQATSIQGRNSTSRLIRRCVQRLLECCLQHVLTALRSFLAGRRPPPARRSSPARSMRRRPCRCRRTRPRSTAWRRCRLPMCKKAGRRPPQRRRPRTRSLPATALPLAPSSQ